MFPLVLPTPLSKKWGAKLAWARKRTQENDTRKENFAPAHASGPRPGHADAHLPIPSTPTASAGEPRRGSLPPLPVDSGWAGASQGRTPTGAIRTQAEANLNHQRAAWEPAPREGECPGQGHGGSGDTLPCPTQPSEQPNEEAEGSGNPGPKSGVSRVPPSGEELRECPL